MTNKPELTDNRSRLRDAAKNYQTALAWYQSNIDSPAALQTWDAATSEFMRAIGYRETDIIADLLDEIDELQERRKADGAEPIYQLFDAGWYDTNKGTYDDVTSAGMKGRIVYAVPQPLTDAERAELQERGKAGDIRDLFLRAKHLMYQSGGSPIENSLTPIDAWLYDAEHAATQSTPLAKGGDNAQ